MKQTLIEQYRHQWRMLEATVQEFSDEAWLNTGYALTTPPLTAYHIFSAVRRYADAEMEFTRSDGSVLQERRGDLDKAVPLTRSEILANIPVFSTALESWLESINLDAPNTEHPWSGPTKGSFVLFLLRHSDYHLGELGALLNQALEGKASDHFANTVAANLK